MEFRTTPTIIAHPGAIARLPDLARGLGIARPGLVTDPTIARLAAPAIDALSPAWTTTEVVPDPPADMILTAAAQARAAGVDGIVSIGGGSSLDTAKLVALLAASDQPLDQIYGVNLATGPRLPLILAPTTAGTGSEVTPISIVTTGTSEKKGVVSPVLFPDIALLDAELTTGLPAAVTAATGIDAMVHAIEAFTSKRLKNPVSDCLAREALRLLGSNIRTACTDPGNLGAREAMLLGSMLAGQAFANAPVAAVHALAYPLGGHFHVPHGLSNALVLPEVLEFNMDAAKPLYAELAPIIFPDLASTPDPATALPDAFRRLGPELGMQSRLHEVGVSHNHIPMLAEDAMKQERLLINNPRDLTLEDAVAIYTAAL